MWNNLSHAMAWAQVGQPTGVPLRQDYLGRRHFLLTVVAALFLHVIALYIWHLMPKTQVIDIPVHALNIKLGDGEVTPEELKAAQPDIDNKGDVEHTISHLVREQDPEVQARTQSMIGSIDKAIAPPPAHAPAPKSVSKSKAVVRGTFDVRQEGTGTAAPVMAVTAHQFVRESAAKTAIPGNSNAKDAEKISNYQQLISLWIEKFMVYQGIEAETTVRIRLDRHGNILYYILEYSTGYPALDRATIDMVKRANPVPPVPADYPDGELNEFLVPVKFHLK